MISDEHRQRYLEYHARKGRLAEKPGDLCAIVEMMCDSFGYTSVLDYGCGCAQQVSQFPPPGVPVQSYDPGVIGADTPPRPADLVVCNHMLEHVEDEAAAAAVLRDLHRLTKSTLYLVISLEESTKELLDGTPWHTLVRDSDWWEKLVNEYLPFASVERGEKEVGFIWRREDA